ncbi:hypothetical protein DFP72DRAFT_818213 [Ephemerocybe angulata]|uniref:Uncharacterized protein n=1 Tax=Ephemerocybe angulata TaxID=980116 RepID=A0A8H6HQN8_9AGAR|nr:hypothetical protein DFP72DRAFT_818213 [Tulosesus angulatus]
MLYFALEYRRAIDRLTGDQASGLRAYELGNEEWELVKQVTDVLKVYKHATLRFSRGTPSLPSVIPAMDHIDDVLTTQSLDTKYLPAVRAACALSKKTLNRYYEKTDVSKTYRIAMMLHPRHKLQYFRNRTWPEEWIIEAHALLRSEFDENYASIPVPDDFAEVQRVTQPKPEVRTIITATLFNAIDFAFTRIRTATSTVK